MLAPARRLFALCAAALLVFTSAGCSKKSTPTKPGTGGGTGPSSAQQLATADSMLGVLLVQQASGQPSRPSDIDFSGPYNTYLNVFQAEPSNLHARLGLAVLGLALITIDPEVNAAWDEWAAYLTSHTPFEVPTGPQPLGVPAGLTPSRGAFRLPYELVPITLVAHSRTALLGADPQLSRIQAILHDRVLPSLDQAIVHLDAIAANPSFQFIVSPEMQGDPDATPVELDVTDVLAMRAGCNLLAALCNQAVAYRVSFASYDSVGLYAAIQPGSPWLKLVSDGTSHMQMAQTRLVNSVDDLESAINSLVAEPATDPNQDDDAIRIGPNALSAAAVDSIRTNLVKVRTALLNGFSVTADWDGDYATPDVALNIRVDRMFTNPVPDWKALLPDYTGSVTRRPFHVFWTYVYGPQTATFAVASGGYYFGSYSLDVSPGGTSEYFYGDAAIVNGLRTLVQSRYAAAQAVGGYSGDFYGSCYFSGSLLSGTSMLSVWVNSGYGIASTFVAVPVITWVAPDVSQWQWPDPTLHGLLPGLTTTNQLLTTFGFNPASWQRVNVLDWTGGGFDSLRVRPPKLARAGR